MKISPFVYTLPDSQVVLKCTSEIEINPFGCYLICGESGAGKSTFLKLLKGFYPEFIDGEISGNLVSFPNSHYLFQNPFTQLIQDDALSEFMFSMENKKFSKIEMDDAKQWLKKIGLNVNEKTKTSFLSHGETQRLLLSSLIAAKPEWIFLDEPTAFLDFNRRQELYLLFGEFKKTTGILIIDHHISEVAPIVDGYFNVVRSGNVAEVIYSKTKPDNFKSIYQDISFDELPKQNENIQIKILGLDFKYEKNNIISKFYGEFSTGKITSIVGPSGAGKTTLLRVLLGILKEENGDILFNNKKEKNRFKFFSYLFQNPESHFLLDTLNEEILSFSFDQEIKNNLLRAFNLDQRLEMNPFMLSEGEKRRLSLLLVMMMKRPFLLLDEPTFGQDTNQVRLIKKFILEYKKKNYGIIIISHDADFYQEISDQVIELNGDILHE